MSGTEVVVEWVCGVEELALASVAVVETPENQVMQNEQLELAVTG